MIFNLILKHVLSLCPLYLSSFYFSPNDSHSKTMKNVVVLKIFKFLYILLPLFLSLSAIVLEIDPRKILKFMMSPVV